MDRSSTLFNEAKNYIPGGVNSPVRAFKGVGGEPKLTIEAEISPSWINSDSRIFSLSFVVSSDMIFVLAYKIIILSINHSK